MNVCIIGGTGFIGSHLINTIASHHCVTNIDIQLPAFDIITVNTKIADVRDYDSIKAVITDNTDCVKLLAAEYRDNLSLASLYYDVNVEGAHNVLKVMVEKNIG